MSARTPTCAECWRSVPVLRWGSTAHAPAGIALGAAETKSRGRPHLMSRALPSLDECSSAQDREAT